MRETDNDAVMERIDNEGNVIGFSILNVSHLSQNHPLVAQLTGLSNA
jgi:methylmalonyl-CoA mutase cobalamin-binding subunit